MIKDLNNNVVFENQFIRLENNDVEFLNWEKWKYLRAYLNKEKRIKDGVVILCINENDEFLFIKNYRYALDKNIWELPRWKYNNNEDAISWAKRELLEETWISNIISSNYLWTTWSDTWIIAWLADIVCLYLDSKDQSIKLQAEENIYDYDWFTLDKIKDFIKKEEIIDWYSQSAIFRYILFKNDY